MAHIRDVLHVAHLVPFVAQIACDHVKGDVRLGMAQVSVIVNRGTAYVHVHPPIDQRDKFLFLARQKIVDCKRH